MGFYILYVCASENDRLQQLDFIILGGGASGLQLAHRLSKSDAYKASSILILESDQHKANDRTWCFWETGDGEWDDLLQNQWSKVQFKSQSIDKTIDLGDTSYKMLRSKPYYDLLHKKIAQNNSVQIKYERCTGFSDKGSHVIVNTEQNTYQCSTLFNSIFDWNILRQQQQYPVLQQHFLGWYIKTPTPVFDVQKAVFMDFTVPQKQETRFMYVLPFTKTDALIEYTLFSEKLIDKSEYESAIRDYLKDKNIYDYELVEVEQGSIPMCSYPFWKNNTKNVHFIGSAGGWTKASTGFTFKNINRKTIALVDHISANKPLSRFAKKNRFWWYDLLFLDVLSKHNHVGAQLFSGMFGKNSPKRIFQFLDEQSHFFQEILIMRSFPTFLFVKQFFKRLFGTHH
ncbi:MAG: lycopene cyclase family protein [Bacteroidota bacterium]|nr:lycopene cyclase family protein [Bacteroidota bacterium]